MQEDLGGVVVVAVECLAGPAAGLVVARRQLEVAAAVVVALLVVDIFLQEYPNVLN